MNSFEQTAHTIHLDEIEMILDSISISLIIDSIQEGFRAYSRGSVVVPPVLEMLFNNPPGRTSHDQISVADLTGVAIQDIQICKLVAGAV